MENIVETKISNMMETIANNIVKEERTSIRNTSVKPTMKDENFGDILSSIQTEQRLLRQEMAATSNLTKKSQRENQWPFGENKRRNGY